MRTHFLLLNEEKMKKERKKDCHGMCIFTTPNLATFLSDRLQIQQSLHHMSCLKQKTEMFVEGERDVVGSEPMHCNPLSAA
jgi:hypothetical protein